MGNNEIELKPFLDEDIKIFDKWLEKEYIRKWYGEKEDWLEEINNRNGKFNFIKHFIVYLNDIKIGFCQYYDCFFLKDLYNNVFEEKHTFGIDYLIGEEEYLNKGIGKIIINKLEEKIIEIGGKEILADPVSENIISQKLLLSNGYIKVKDGEYIKKI